MNQGTCVVNPAAQDGQSRAGLHRHPPQEQFLHERFYSSWRMPENPSVTCCNDADCHPAEIRYVDGNIQARRREDGKYTAVAAKKVERKQTIRTAEITC